MGFFNNLTKRKEKEEKPEPPANAAEALESPKFYLSGRPFIRHITTDPKEYEELVKKYGTYGVIIEDPEVIQEIIDKYGEEALKYPLGFTSQDLAEWKNGDKVILEVG